MTKDEQSKIQAIREQQAAETKRAIQYLLTFGLLPGVWPKEEQVKVKFRVAKQEEQNGNL